MPKFSALIVCQDFLEPLENLPDYTPELQAMF